jgi:hypothetical protein
MRNRKLWLAGALMVTFAVAGLALADSADKKDAGGKKAGDANQDGGRGGRGGRGGPGRGGFPAPP